MPCDGDNWGGMCCEAVILSVVPLWVVSYDGCTVGSVMWWLYWGKCHVVVVLWVVTYDGCTGGSVMWWLYWG